LPADRATLQVDAWDPLLKHASMLDLLPLSLWVAASAQACVSPIGTTIRDVHHQLGERAVDAVKRASRPDWEADATLARFVTADASFQYIIGDAGRAFPVGPKGAHAFAIAIDATHFRFGLWSAMPFEADLCAKHKVVVEFGTKEPGEAIQVTFEFEQGRIQRAEGWRRVYAAGTMRD
jgi:hypothetical protein